MHRNKARTLFICKKRLS
jgi:hypothetical protein